MPLSIDFLFGGGSGPGYVPPDIFSGARRFDTPRVEHDLRVVEKFEKLIDKHGPGSPEVARYAKSHKRVWTDILAGKWRLYISDADLYGAQRAYSAKPTRFGDLPLRPTKDAVLPAVGGAMRKIPLGALAGRVAGPAGWAITGASLLGPLWELAGRTKGPLGLLRGFNENQRLIRSIPQSPRPEIQPVRVTGRKLIAPVVVTAKRITRPTGMVVTGSAAASPGVPWWQQVLQPLIALALKPRTPSSAPRISIVNSPFTDSPPQPDTGGLPIPDPLTPLEPGSAECDCGPKKPRKPRKPREKCRTGRFIERLSGIQKYQTRGVPCRPSRKKLR